MPTKFRLDCPSCGGIRFKVAGIGKLLCQGKDCNAQVIYLPGQYRLTEKAPAHLRAQPSRRTMIVDENNT